MFALNDKVALVTGGSRGIGRATCIAFANAGAYVAINFRSNQDAADETLRLVNEAGGKGEVLGFDVSDPEAVDNAIKDLAKRQGRLDILINNAGIAPDQLLLRITPEELESIWATNINGAIYCAKAAVRPMMRQKNGRIINLSSVVAEAGNPGQAAYSTSKAALIGLTKSLAREYASRGITVNAVAPGYIDTEMTEGITGDFREKIIETTPLGRVGTPEEVAATIAFLASDAAAYITGQVVRVNGGMYV